MCTSMMIKWESRAYFGRNMDLHYEFPGAITRVAKGETLYFKSAGSVSSAYSFHGMGFREDGFPLLADGVNECGLFGAALEFPSAHYVNSPDPKSALALAPYELLPYVLGSASSVKEANERLLGLCITDTPFNSRVGTSPLHFHFADSEGSITVEPRRDGVVVADDPYNILTNDPPFDFHLRNASHYSHLTPHQPKEESASYLGLGGVGLPGDYTSASRFVKLAFLKKFAKAGDTEGERIATVFSLMGAVAPPPGAVLTRDGAPHFTVYTSVIDAATGEYRYRTHTGEDISAKLS